MSPLPRKLTDEERELAERMPVAMVEQCREQDIPDLEIIERVAGYCALSFERLSALEALLGEVAAKVPITTKTNDIAQYCHCAWCDNAWMQPNGEAVQHFPNDCLAVRLRAAVEGQ